MYLTNSGGVFHIHFCILKHAPESATATSRSPFLYLINSRRVHLYIS